MDLTITFYSELTNKNESEEYELDLENLKNTFPLDVTFKNNKITYNKENNNGFVHLSFMKRRLIDEWKGSDTIAENYNRPPIGPLPTGTVCIFCRNSFPNFHKETCELPKDSSLELNTNGIIEYIFENNKYKGPLSEFKDQYDNGTLSKNQISDMLKDPDSELSGLQYIDFVKKRGAKKVESDSMKDYFENSIIIKTRFTLESVNGEIKEYHPNIRISKNGVINIVTCPWEIQDLSKEVCTRINKSIPDFTCKNTYLYLLSGQFRLWSYEEYAELYS